MIDEKKYKQEMIRRNKNNRVRGGKFEKTVADLLNMFAVPYSGSNTRFGLGDIRDVEGTTGGMWLGECKSVTIDDVDNPIFILKKSWIVKLIKKAQLYNTSWFLAFTRYKRSEKYILICDDMFEKLSKIYTDVTGQLIEVNTAVLAKTQYNMVNYHMPEKLLRPLVRNKHVTSLKFWHMNDDNIMHILSINGFDEILKATKHHTQYR